jgi:TRAP-type C4-dicarboxylate transport system substrate-binding protein
LNNNFDGQHQAIASIKKSAVMKWQAIRETKMKHEGVTRLNRIHSLLVLGMLAIAVVLSISVVQAQNKIPEHSFKVIGSFANLSPFLKYEQPFWTQTLPKNSGGALKTDIKPHTELGLKGFELLRLVSLGVFDFGHIVIGYVAADSPVFEGIDLAALTQDLKQQRAISESYKEVLGPRLEKKHGVKLLGLTPFPTNMFFCKPEVKSLADLRGKKIRVYSTTLGDFVDGAGGVSVTMPFPFVIPALEKGTIDCAVGGAVSAYSGKWNEVTTSIFGLHVGNGMNIIVANLKMWNNLDEQTRAFISSQIKDFEDKIWAGTEKEDQEGLDCDTGKVCPLGAPVNMKLFNPPAEDLVARDQIVQDFVLKRWVQRCGADCAKDWNRTIGAVLHMTAQ